MPEIARWNPARSAWETTENALCGHSAVYSATFPSSGMTQRGRLLPLPTLAHLTDANESSSSPGLLPTPTVGNIQGGNKTRSGPRSGELLLPGVALELMKTPTAQLAINGGSQHPDKRRAGGHGPALADQIEQQLVRFASPTARDGNGRGGANKTGGANLPEMIEALLSTPTVQDSANTAGPSQATRNTPPLNSVAASIGAPSPPPSEDGSLF